MDLGMNNSQDKLQNTSLSYSYFFFIVRNGMFCQDGHVIFIPSAQLDKISHGTITLAGNSCRSGTGPIFIPNIVKSLLSVWFSGLK